MFDNEGDPWYQRCKQQVASTERFLDVAFNRQSRIPMCPRSWWSLSTSKDDSFPMAETSRDDFGPRKCQTRSKDKCMSMNIAPFETVEGGRCRPVAEEDGRQVRCCATTTSSEWSTVAGYKGSWSGRKSLIVHHQLNIAGDVT